MANELLRFENGTMGIALNLEERQIGVVVLGDSDGIDEDRLFVALGKCCLCRLARISRSRRGRDG